MVIEEPQVTAPTEVAAFPTLPQMSAVGGSEVPLHENETGEGPELVEAPESPGLTVTASAFSRISPLESQALTRMLCEPALIGSAVFTLPEFVKYALTGST